MEERKQYSFIALFICLSSKAIHLELVTNCTVETFVGDLKIYMTRREQPSTILSDNARTFKGVDKDIKDVVYSKKVENFIGNLQEEGIHWKYIPPLSPHFGGMHEAGVKGVKQW